MTFRLFAASIVAALLTSANALACVGLGEKKAIDCIDETGGKNCSCTIIKNACTTLISVNWTILGGSKQGATIEPGKSADACTTRRGQSVAYTGYTTVGGAPKTASGLSPTCDAIWQETKKIYDQLDIVQASQGSSSSGSADLACSMADYYEKSYKLRIALVGAKRRGRDAGCGVEEADVKRFASESFASQKSFVEWSASCKSRTEPKSTSTPYQPSRPAASSSASSTSNNDLPIAGGHIDSFGNSNRPDPTPAPKWYRPSDIRMK